jgi:hypothetical protein
MARRTKATKAQKRGKRRARAKDYALMLTAATAVVVDNRGVDGQHRAGNIAYVLMTFPHWVKFAEDFPKGHITVRTLLTNTYKVNAVKLLDWLYKHGHSSYNASMLVRGTKDFELLDDSVDKLLSLDIVS